MNWVEPDFDRNLAAVFASSKEFPPGAHRSSLWVAKVTVPIAHVLTPESLGNEHLDGLVDEFIALVAKKGLDLFVYKGDPSFFVNHDHRGSRRIDHQPEALFGKPALSDVEQNTVHQDTLAITVELGTAAPDKPANFTIRQHHPVFDWIFCACLQGILHGLTHHVTILRMDNIPNAFRIELFRWREAKNSPRFVGNPNFIARDVPSPQGEVDGIGRDLHVLFRFAQCGLTRFQSPRELRRSSDVGTQLIAHGQHDSGICKAEEKRDVDDSPDHERDVPCQ